MKTKNRKTKVEIIEETAAFYNSDNRGRDVYICQYFIGGKMCAFGRCMIDPQKKRCEGFNPNKSVQDEWDLDSLLKEEYRGHNHVFWRKLQSFHDVAENWNDKGLTLYGEMAKEVLLKAFA
jgi:hypothetical protein